MPRKRLQRRAEKRLGVKEAAYQKMCSADRVNGAKAYTKPGSYKPH